MHALKKLFAERLSTGLKRQSITTCSKWAEQYRVMGGKDFPGKWSFKWHPWLKEMMDSTAELNIGKKSAQMGFTEAILNKAFFKIDVESTDVLYVLPAKTPDASDFSSGRFDAALELSSHLSLLFSHVKNVGHKRAGSVNFYIRGAKSKSGLKSIPVGFLALDEIDEFSDRAIPLAKERQSGQMKKEAWAISTPTIENKGIDALYQLSTQEHFFFICPSCSKLTELIYPDCIEITADQLNDPRLNDTYLKCKECKNKLSHETKTTWLQTGRWIPGYTNRDSRGFYINQLYSATVTPKALAEAALLAANNPADEQEFYNSKLGLEHMVDGAKINDAMLDACTGDYISGEYKVGTKLITMGVDVGTWLHTEVCEWTLPANIIADLNIESFCKVIECKKYQHFHELDGLMYKYRINFCVIDAHPERRKAFEFASRFWGHVKMCFYARGIQGKQITVNKEPNGEPTISVDRTSWLDLSLGRFRNSQIRIPKDTSEEYRKNVKALVRMYEKDIDGNVTSKYVKGNENDHFAHARNYAEIALPFAASVNVSSDIREHIV